MNEVLIRGGHGGRIDAKEGQVIEVINVGGRQVCSLFSFNLGDPGETLSPGHSRVGLRRIVLEVGDILVSCYRNPVFEILEDSCGEHDFTLPPCDPTIYERRFGLKNHRSCRTNLAKVMADKDIPYDYLPESVNLFQSTRVLADGSILVRSSPARPGDKVALRVLQDVIVAASACPMPGGKNGDGPTDIRLIVHEG